MNESIEIYDINKNDEVDQFIDLLNKFNETLYIFNNELLRKNWNLEYAVENRCSKYIIGVLSNINCVETNKRYSFNQIKNDICDSYRIETIIDREFSSLFSKERTEKKTQIINECVEWIIKHFCEKEDFLFVGNKILERPTGNYFVVTNIDNKIYFVNIYDGTILKGLSFLANKNFNGIGLYYHEFIQKINEFCQVENMKYDIVKDV